MLRERFDAAFFDEELGTYVLALDGEKKPCRVRSSNAGHALFTGVARPERAGRVVERADVERVVFRLGRAHPFGGSRPLQSHELSQRLGLAARQPSQRPDPAACTEAAFGVPSAGFNTPE